MERRAQARQPISLEVFISPARESNKRIKSRITNMSLMGCAIEPNSYRFSNKEQLSICFVASRQGCSMSTIIKAQVVHIGNDYIGLCFDSMGADVIDILRGLLKEAKYF
jgi:hypothetical protein